MIRRPFDALTSGLYVLTNIHPDSGRTIRRIAVIRTVTEGYLASIPGSHMGRWVHPGVYIEPMGSMEQSFSSFVEGDKKGTWALHPLNLDRFSHPGTAITGDVGDSEVYVDFAPTPEEILANKKIFFEAVTERVAGVVTASQVGEPSREDVVIELELFKQGNCSHHLVIDEAGHGYDFRNCALCGKHLGLI